MGAKTSRRYSSLKSLLGLSIQCTQGINATYNQSLLGYNLGH